MSSGSRVEPSAPARGRRLVAPDVVDVFVYMVELNLAVQVLRR